MYRNNEHYPDPTAGAALASIRRKENLDRMNEGKQFEADWKASSEQPGVWYYRFRDSPITYYGGSDNENIRFAQDNICDCQLFRSPCLHLIELKTVDAVSAPLTSMLGAWQPDKGEYKKQKHLREMADAATRPGITASVVINYRRTGHTYAVTPDDLLAFVALARFGGRKSVPEDWCAAHGLPVAGRKLRVHWRYDVSALLDALEAKQEVRHEHYPA